MTLPILVRLLHPLENIDFRIAISEWLERHFLKIKPKIEPHIQPKIKNFIGLLVLTVIALLIHGYHPYAEDAEIYLPGVLKILNPSLFPANAEFFGEHTGHTLYPNLIAFSVQITHLPLAWVAFLWQFASIFLLLAGARRLAAALFESESPDAEPALLWGAVALMAALLTLPIAGTALYILDQFLNPRNFAAFATLFALSEVLHRKSTRRYGRAGLWLAFATVMHPFMASFAILFCAWLVLLDQYRPRILGFAAALPFGITFGPPPTAYHEVALRQRSHFVLRWEWYEWLGVIGPVLLFWWFGSWARRRGMKNLELVSRAMVPFVVLAAAAAIGLGIPARFEALTRLQPLRCLALCYMVLVVVGGGLRWAIHTATSGVALAGAIRSAQPGNVFCAAASVSRKRAHRMAMGEATQPVGAGL